MTECLGEVHLYRQLTRIYPDDVRGPGLWSNTEKVPLCSKHARDRTLLERQRLREIKKSRARWTIGAKWYDYELLAGESTAQPCADAGTE